MDYNKQEINLQRLLRASEKLASQSARELALAATAATGFSKHGTSDHKSSYVVNIFRKYLDEIARMLDQMTLAREEYEKTAAEQIAATSNSDSASNTVTAPATNTSIIHSKKKSSFEPPLTESLEEYRRKLSFLANLLNGPRWAVPHNEAAINRVTRNLRLDHNQQLREIETAAKVQLHVQDEMRQQLTLPPLSSSYDHPSQRNDYGESSYNDSSFTESSYNDSSSHDSSGPDSRLSSPRLGSQTTSPPSSPFTSKAKPNFASRIIRSTGDDNSDSNISHQNGDESIGHHSDFDEISDSTSNDYHDGIASNDTEQYDSGTEHDDDSLTQPTSPYSSSRAIDRIINSQSQTSISRHKRSPSIGDDQLGDLNRLLTADVKLQEDLTEELVKYAAAMKETAISTGAKLQADAMQLEKMGERVDSNVRMTESASSTVTQLLNATSSSTYGYFLMIFIVILAFVVVYIFMKIVPKPRS